MTSFSGPDLVVWCKFTLSEESLTKTSAGSDNQLNTVLLGYYVCESIVVLLFEVENTQSCNCEVIQEHELGDVASLGECFTIDRGPVSAVSNLDCVIVNRASNSNHSHSWVLVCTFKFLKEVLYGFFET